MPKGIRRGASKGKEIAPRNPEVEKAKRKIDFSDRSEKKEGDVRPAADPIPASRASKDITPMASQPSLPPRPAPPRSRLLIDPKERLHRRLNHVIRSMCSGPPYRRKRCRVCTAAGLRADTAYHCSVCDIPLCNPAKRDCFHRYHTQRRIWAPVPPKPPQGQPPPPRRPRARGG